tara:strand:- start:107 stop:295 length:189 start_codon:yes stop_codon:yes gene_type:complete
MNKKYTILINKITDARKKNNINWMNLLKVAIKHAPKQSKKILKNINQQDKKISKLLKQITNN